MLVSLCLAADASSAYISTSVTKFLSLLSRSTSKRTFPASRTLARAFSLRQSQKFIHRLRLDVAAHERDPRARADARVAAPRVHRARASRVATGSRRETGSNVARAQTIASRVAQCGGSAPRARPGASSDAR